MISFRRDGSEVVVEVESDSTVNSRFFRFKIAFGNELYADLLTRNFQHKFETLIEDVRREEYERGWKHAKAKKARTSWFPCVLRKVFDR